MRALSSLLIPMILISQCLVSIPHSHAGAPHEHSALPHIHLHNHSHAHHHGHYHDHHHADESERVPPSTPLGGNDHDSDAVYLSDVWGADNARYVDLPSPETSHFVQFRNHWTALQLAHCRNHGPPDEGGLRKPPLYLLTHSIRC